MSPKHLATRSLCCLNKYQSLLIKRNQKLDPYQNYKGYDIIAYGFAI